MWWWDVMLDVDGQLELTAIEVVPDRRADDWSAKERRFEEDEDTDRLLVC